MMFERLMARVEDKVRAMAEAARRNLEIAFAAIPDVRLKVEGDALAIEAKGLARRRLSDMRMRFAFWTNP